MHHHWHNDKLWRWLWRDGTCKQALNRNYLQNVRDNRLETHRVLQNETLLYRTTASSVAKDSRSKGLFTRRDYDCDLFIAINGLCGIYHCTVWTRTLNPIQRICCNRKFTVAMILCEQPYKRKLVFGHIMALRAVDMVRLRLRFFIQCRFSHVAIVIAKLNPTQLISCRE